MMVRFNRAVACIEKSHLSLGIVPLKCSGSSRSKEWIVFTPNCESRRLVAAEEFVQLTVLLNILAAIEEQIHLRFHANALDRRVGQLVPSGAMSDGSSTPSVYCHLIISAVLNRRKASRF
jgi:hypothetical protein